MGYRPKQKRNGKGQFAGLVVPESLETRFWRYVRKGPETACWEWIGARFKTGYGALHNNGRNGVLYAHRFSFELHKGPIPKGAHILHSCDYPACVNPDHLVAGTARDNLQDMARKLRGWHGSKAVGAKLTEGQVLIILERHKAGETCASLARAFGVSISAVSSITRGQRWKHLTRHRTVAVAPAQT